MVVNGLGGPKKHRELHYAEWLAEQGYVTLMINSFRTRGVGHAIQIWRALKVTTAMITADAFAALEYLSRHPRVNRDQIAVIGFSYGGMVSILTVYERMHELYLPGGPAFAFHASYYGSSIPRLEDPVTTRAPVLVFVGSKDRNVSISRTRSIVDDLRAGGSDVELKIFDAYHQWDGGDRTFRRALFHLRYCNIRIDADGTVRDERSGRKIDGFWSRLLFLLRYAGIRGYLMRHDAAILEQSNALLLSFLKRMKGRKRRTCGEPER